MSYSKSYFSTQFNLYYRPLCLYALRLLDDTDEAEDVVQDTFAALWEKRETRIEIADMKSYLYTAVRNNCLMKLRTKKEFDDVNELQLVDENIQNEDIARAELEAKLWKMIDELPERQREIFLMAKRDGMAYKEIAEETGLSVKTVENHVTRALKSLRQKDPNTFLFFFA
ncbi:MAG: polymerase sigma-70 factor, expansion family 1 [Bacteroidetes bacterium]|nr:polymerase sigma-70 factor, expansion family 1 [Bacteroidota bacterium]